MTAPRDDDGPRERHPWGARTAGHRATYDRYLEESFWRSAGDDPGPGDDCDGTEGTRPAPR